MPDERKLPLRTRPRVLATLALSVPLALAVAACGSGGNGTAPADAATVTAGPAVVIGASLSLTGSLDALGRPLEAGYQQEIADVNAAGGVAVGGARLSPGSSPPSPPRSAGCTPATRTTPRRRSATRLPRC